MNMNSWQRCVCSCVLVLVATAGCQNGGRTASPGDAAMNPQPVLPAPGTILVQDENYDGGAVATRRTGYKDENGEFVIHGTLTNFWENGQKKSEINFVHGVRHGLRQAWYQGGQLWSEGHYVNGKEHGTWMVWFPDGRKAQEIGFDHGAFHGPYKEWYVNGFPKKEFNYIRGKKHGLMRIWDEEGVLRDETMYVDDIPQP
jgi:antitoxin component YwqK of YwqJK toxin-antitoxin module